MIRPSPFTRTTGLQNEETTTQLQISRWALPLLLLLALLHGVQYAALMPPWGLIDEAQHVDYVWHIAERGEFPVAGQTTLSPELIDSLFATRHWFIFQWPAPASTAIADLGATGSSYEAYHPPLFYLLMAPVYLGAPGSILDRLFVLRGVTVALSLVTVYFIFRISVLVSGSARFALLTTLIFIMLPERTAYASRVNNDVLVELLGASVCLVSTYGILQSLTRPRAVGLGLLMALGIWTKLSMSFWLAPLTLLAIWMHPRPDGRRWLLSLTMGAVALGALLARNWTVYGDVTGFNAFHGIYQIAAPNLQYTTLLVGLQDLFRHFWFIWWKGSQVSTTLLTETIYLALALLTLASTALLAHGLWRRRHEVRTKWRSNPLLALFLYFAAAAFVYACMTLFTYFQGVVPVIQGRFLAPAIAVYVLLYAYGWWQHRFGANILLLTALALFFVGVLVLWGNLLPYHYYWSSVNASMGAVRAAGSAAAILLWSNLTADKPPAVIPLLPFVVVVYWLTAAVTFYWTWRWSVADRSGNDRTAGD